MSISIKVHVDRDELERYLKTIQDLDGHAEDALEIAGMEAYQMVAQKFRVQGPGWRPLAERTKLARSNKNKASIKILQDSGRLRLSIVGQQSSDSVYQLTGRELLIGSNLVYAGVHQRGHRNIPARPYLPTPEELVPRIEKKLARWLNERLDSL